MYLMIAGACFYRADIHSFGDKTIFGIRSQGLDSVLELAGWQQNIYKYDQDSNYGTFAVAAKYTRSIRPDQIAQFLFGSDCLRFSGSRAEREPGDILADYFGLSPDFSSGVSFSPHISNTIIDFDWFQAFDAYLPGLFIMLHMPVVHTKWNLYFNEVVNNPGTAFYPAGYMGSVNIPASGLPISVEQAMRGNTVFGDMDQPLKYGKIFGRQILSRIAELQATLGWNYNQLWYHAGISLRVGAPTGNVPDAEFIFEHIVGNRHHWDVGVGLSGHVNIWENKQAGRRIAVYADAHISHLCTSQQKRSFDFIKNGNGSRYILLEQIENPADGLVLAGNESPDQYVGNLVPAINYTTLDTKISIGVQADIALKLAYQRDGLEIDLGYNFWANSKEKVHCRESFIENRFALKGDAQIYGFTTDNNPLALNATQSMSTILAGQGEGNGNFRNLNADNPAIASSSQVALNPVTQLNSADSISLGIVQAPVNGSNTAILLTDNDINVVSGILPRALSHKVFGYMGYLWNNRDDFDPYLGVGLSSEFANTNVCNNATCSQWAIWVRGGIAY